MLQFDANFKNFKESGKTLIQDSKVKKSKPLKAPPSMDEGPVDGHERFIKQCIQNKISKKEVIEAISKFIEVEEAKL
jgi:hypothetical protein